MLKLFKQAFLLAIPFLWNKRTSRIATTTTLGITLINAVAHTAEPWLLGYLIKQYCQLSLTALILTIGLLVSCWWARMTLGRLQEMVFFRVINQAVSDIRLRVITQLHQVPLQAWDRYNIPEIISANARVSSSIRQFMSVSFVKVLQALIKMVTFSIAMLHTHRSTWYFLLLILLTYGPTYAGIRSFLYSRRHVWESTDQVFSAMDSSLQNSKFLRFHLATEKTRLAPLFDKEAYRWWYNNFQLHRIHLVQATWFFLFAGGLMIHLLLLLRAGQLTVPDWVVIKGYVLAMYRQMSGITLHIRNLLCSLIDLKKVLELLALPTRSESEAPSLLASVSATKAPVMQVSHVSFRYTQQSPLVLQEISLTIWQGDQLAIIGSSGVGKSTLCHLLAGLYTPQQGEVLLYGTPLQQLSMATIGRYIHFIDQEANLINGTIAENLMADLPTSLTTSLAYLKERLRQATGKQGEKLSGGEKQRILLARCLSYQPQILILDETVSNLDEASAQALLQLVLDTVPTVILVTHRQSLLQKFKRIYRLEARQLRPVSITRTSESDYSR